MKTIMRLSIPMEKPTVTVAVLHFTKLLRFMAMWIALYIMDKVYQARYVSRVYIDGLPPPTLVGLVVCAVGVEAIVALFIGVVLMLLMNMFKRPTNTYAIDSGLIAMFLCDYVVTTVLFLVMGLWIGGVSQELFRYSEDGLRGIRALTFTLLWLAAALILLFPAYLTM